MLLRADRLFDGVAGDVSPDVELEVEGGRIRAVRTRTSSASPDVLDLGDVTVLPGLVDVHQHLAFDASDDPVGHLQAQDDAALREGMVAAAQRALAAGITTVRDLGDRAYLGLAVRDRFRDGPELGPRVLASGPPITTPGGHCWFLGGEAEGEQGLRSAVRERAERGVDVVKVMATGGNLTPTVGPHVSQFSRAELSAVVDEAHRHGLPVAAHAHGSQGVLDALAAGVDTLEHCTLFTADGVDSDPALLARLASSEVAISLTGATLPGSQPPFPALRQRLEAVVANAATMVAAGARVVMSSDAGIGPPRPHDVLPHGVASLRLLGMTNAQALLAVTAVAAQVCGIAEETGTVEVGKAADLLVVRGNPLDDLGALLDVVAVFARGRQVGAAG